MRRFLLMSKIIAMCVLTACLFAVTSLVWSLQNVVSVLPTQALALVSEEADKTREALREEIAETRRQAVKQIAEAQDETLSRVDALLAEVRATRELAEVRSADGIAVLDMTALSVDYRLARFEDEMKPRLDHIDLTVGAVGSVATQISSELPHYLDCQVNPDCIYALYQRQSAATERTMDSIHEAAEHLPETMQAIQQTTESTALIAKRWETPWYKKLGRGVKRLFTNEKEE